MPKPLGFTSKTAVMEFAIRAKLLVARNPVSGRAKGF